VPKIALEDVRPAVDNQKIGISYSGGGPRVVIELGCARAFVESGIRPAVIAGVSTGGLAGAAHALDPVSGRGIDLAAQLLTRISSRRLGLNKLNVYWKLLLFALRRKPHGLGDNSVIGSLIKESIASRFPDEFPSPITIGSFKDPRLLIAATNRHDGTAHWFPSETELDAALVTSSAVPGVFPWRPAPVGREDFPMVDGGVVTNQPISQLALEGCGTIYACSIGYGGGAVPNPTDLLDNALACLWMAVHQTMKLEEDYVREKIAAAGGKVIHIHPEVSIPSEDFNFTAVSIETAMRDACEKTKAHLATNPRK